MSASKKIILGVTGSIAAHKGGGLGVVTHEGECDVRVVMTADAQHFITPLPFKTLTRNPVVTNLYDRRKWLETDARSTRGRSGFIFDCSGDGKRDRENGKWFCR